MKVRIDRETCVGCGVCVEICPNLFELDETNIAVAKTQTVPKEEEGKCKEAVTGCPVEAIIIED